MKQDFIRQRIIEIRGERVMLDFELATLYGVEVRVLNQAVKRNRDKFPRDFMFRLTKKEWLSISSRLAISSGSDLRKNSSQIVMSSRKHRGKVYLPYAFSEHGVTMAATVLKSKKAVKMSITVVRAFITLKRFAVEHKDLATQLKELRNELYERLGEHDTQLAAIYDAIESLLDEKVKNRMWEKRHLFCTTQL